MNSIIKVQLLHENAKLPSKISKESAGYDLYAIDNVIIPGSYIDEKGLVNIGKAIIPMGIAIQLPHGTVGKIASRSGLSTKFNIEVGAGWIDSDYRGELMIELRNFNSSEYKVKRGDRIAQLIVLNLNQSKIETAEKLDNSERGYKGLGSSGK